jgi:hypothetical protein
MMPQQLATTVADGDPVSSRILVVVDESDHPVRALRYVGTLLCDTRDVHVTRFHIETHAARALGIRRFQS